MKLTWYQTNGGTFRILVDGLVHPRLVAFTGETPLVTINERLAEVFPTRKIDVVVKHSNMLEFTVEELPPVITSDSQLIWQKNEQGTFDILIDGGKHPRLTGFVVEAGGSAPDKATSEEIRKRLNEFFPEKKIDFVICHPDSPEYLATPEDRRPIPNEVAICVPGPVGKLFTPSDVLDPHGYKTVAVDMAQYVKTTTDVHVLEYLQVPGSQQVTRDVFRIDPLTGLVNKFVGFDLESGYHYPTTALRAEDYKSKEEALAVAELPVFPEGSVAYRKLRISYFNIT